MLNIAWIKYAQWMVRFQRESYVGMTFSGQQTHWTCNHMYSILTYRSCSGVVVPTLEEMSLPAFTSLLFLPAVTEGWDFLSLIELDWACFLSTIDNGTKNLGREGKVCTKSQWAALTCTYMYHLVFPNDGFGKYWNFSVLYELDCWIVPCCPLFLCDNLHIYSPALYILFYLSLKLHHSPAPYLFWTSWINKKFVFSTSFLTCLFPLKNCGSF